MGLKHRRDGPFSPGVEHEQVRESPVNRLDDTPWQIDAAGKRVVFDNGREVQRNSSKHLRRSD